MPLSTKVTSSEGKTYGNPFIGPINHVDSVRLDVSGLTTAEVDANGYLKPGVPLLATGLLVTAPATIAHGVTIEPIKVAASNSAADIAAGVDIDVGLGQIGLVSRAICEDNLGRVLTANEIAALAIAGSLLKLIA